MVGSIKNANIMVRTNNDEISFEVVQKLNAKVGEDGIIEIG
jgi:hypothetical protein